MPTRLRYPELAPEGIAHMRALDHYLNATTTLPAVLLELIRLRVSLKNRCGFCIGHHTSELHKHNEPESRIEAVEDWPNADAFTPRERSALAWADAVTDIQTEHASDSAYANVSTFFHGKDLVDLTLAIASMNAWNRMSIAFGAEWDPSRGKRQSLASSNRNPDSGIDPEPSTTTASPALPIVEQSVVHDDGSKVAQD